MVLTVMTVPFYSSQCCRPVCTVSTGLRTDKAAEVELFPAFKGGDALAVADGERTEDGQFSALLGDWKAPEVVRPPAAEAATDTATPAPAAAAKPPVYVVGAVGDSTNKHDNGTYTVLRAI